MAAGLAERERIREAFGTYLDREVAEYILSEGFSEEGVELEVSILFCDVRDFTSFAAERRRAARSSPASTSCSRSSSRSIARHGGHVDKFERRRAARGLRRARGRIPTTPTGRVRAALEMATAG